MPFRDPDALQLSDLGAPPFCRLGRLGDILVVAAAIIYVPFMVVYLLISLRRKK